MPSLFQALLFIGFHIFVFGAYILLMFGISEWESKRKLKR